MLSIKKTALFPMEQIHITIHSRVIRLHTKLTLLILMALLTGGRIRKVETVFQVALADGAMIMMKTAMLAVIYYGMFLRRKHQEATIS